MRRQTDDLNDRSLPEGKETTLGSEKSSSDKYKNAPEKKGLQHARVKHKLQTNVRSMTI